MENTAQLDKANTIKALVDASKPVTEWGMTSNIWARPDGNGGHVVRVYLNTKKRKLAAILNISDKGLVTAEWQPGHSMTRNELCGVLGVE